MVFGALVVIPKVVNLMVWALAGWIVEVILSIKLLLVGDKVVTDKRYFGLIVVVG